MERDTVVDVAKGIGIITVIIGHLNHFFSYDDLIPTLVYSFHMPLFIILSGYIFNYRSETTIKEYFYKRFRQIIKPYFVFAAITYIYNYIRVVGAEDAEGIYGIFIGNGIDGHLNFNIALWFLPMLFFCNIIFGCTVKLSRCIKDQAWVSWVVVTALSIFFTGGGDFLVLKTENISIASCIHINSSISPYSNPPYNCYNRTQIYRYLLISIANIMLVLQYFKCISQRHKSL